MDTRTNRVVVADFDGFWTDAEQEGTPFVVAYRRCLKVVTDLSREVVERIAQECEAQLVADPGRYGWLYAGKVMAPSCVDPYLRSMPVARAVFDQAGRFTDPRDRELLIQLLFSVNYPKTLTVFRPGAREAFLSLWERWRDVFYVVTNSGTEPVCNKIRALLGQLDGLEEWLTTHVVGDARKYDPTQIPEQAVFVPIPAELELPGLRRKVVLCRPHYFRALDTIRRRHGVRFEDMVVGGDVFELDLSLPLALGARVALLGSERTPTYERPYLSAHPRGRVLTDIREFPGFVMAE